MSKTGDDNSHVRKQGEDSRRPRVSKQQAGYMIGAMELLCQVRDDLSKEVTFMLDVNSRKEPAVTSWRKGILNKGTEKQSKKKRLCSRKR